MHRRPSRSTPPPLLVLALSGILAACGTSTIEPDGSGAMPITELPRALTAPEVEVLEASNSFGFDLLRQVHATDPSENSFLSPLSASMALGMALNGAAGGTFDAMRETLGFGGLELGDINASYRSLVDLLRNLDPNVRFQIGNSVWYRHGWTPETDYLERVTAVFDAEIAGLDFSSPTAADVMNQWVSDATNGRIEDIVVPPIDPLTVAFLINAIDFEGLWTEDFDPDDTRSAAFHNQDGSTGTVRLMARNDVVSFASGSGFQAIDLPYGGQAYSMTIVLPDEGRAVGDLVEALTASEWGAITSSFANRDLEIRIPRFQMKWEASLNDVLKALGMAAAFDPEVADFVVDRPFLFAIRERLSGTILFVGVIVEAPEA